MRNEDIRNFRKLSHELKIPVSNLILILETMYEYDRNISINRKREFFRLAIKEVDTLQNLINYFSDFNIQPTSMNKNNTDFQNADYLDDLTFTSKSLYFQKNIFITSYIHHRNTIGSVNINLRTYKNIILNLLGNANKFIGYEGWIFLETDILASISLLSFGYVGNKRVSVVDDGIGMAASIQLFIKSDGFNCYETKQNIGLLIVKEMLSAYQILLNTISYPSRGVKMFFNLNIIY